MTDNNDPLKFLKDLENGVAETTDAAAKAVQNGVSTLIDGVGNAVDSAVALFNKGNDTNSDDQESQAEERPAKYRDNREVTFKRLGSKRIRVHEVYYDEEGRQCESPQQFISLSRTGVELLGGNALRPKILKSFNIKNADLYKEGETKAGNPFLSAFIGGAMGSQSETGPLKGAAIGLISTATAHDIWYLRISEHDNSISIYRLDGKADGEAVIDFLDAFALT